MLKAGCGKRNIDLLTDFRLTISEPMANLDQGRNRSVSSIKALGFPKAMDQEGT